MPLGNTTLWGSLLPGTTDPSADAGGTDGAIVIDQALPTLHADSRANLTFWSEAELVQWMDEALKRASRKFPLFIGRSASTLTVPAQATYALPSQHVMTLHVSLGTEALRRSSTEDLEARDPSYQTTAATSDAPVDHWYEDRIGSSSIGLAPVPSAEIPLPIIYAGWPNQLDPSSMLIAAPAPIKGYLAMAMLAEAYGKEGESEMPDVAQHCRGMAGLYENVFQGLYGGL